MFSSSSSSAPHIVVVGAGAFGGWTALFLRRRGARVTLLDSWGPGNARASSGDDTRIIRAIYGDKPACVALAARAMTLWREHEQRWQRRLYTRTGLLWLAGSSQALEQASVRLLRAAGLAVEELSAAAAARRFPQIVLDDVGMALFEPEAGYLTARLACEAVLDAFLAEGGEYRQMPVRAPRWDEGEGAGELRKVTLADGSTLGADGFVFACGPWLSELLGDSIPARVEPSRQEVFYFGTTAGDERFDEGRCPTWVDSTSGTAIAYYGIPGNRWRGFKVGDNTRGAAFEPTGGERTVTAEGVRAAREYLARRFPALRGAPLVESRVCQYENSPDGEYLLDRHPSAANVWIAGGGSGHGFKAGPAVGELMARLVLEDARADPAFRFGRFSG